MELQSQLNRELVATVAATIYAAYLADGYPARSGDTVREVIMLSVDAAIMLVKDVDDCRRAAADAEDSRRNQAQERAAEPGTA